jgi:hypothetical protein
MRSKKKSQNAKPPNQDFAQEGYYPQLSGVAQEQEQGSFPGACHGSNEKASVEAKQVVKSVKTGLALIDRSSKGPGKLHRAKKLRQKPRKPKQKPRKLEK